MLKVIQILLLLGILSFALPQKAVAQGTSKIDLRLLEIDLSLVLRQYERVRMQAFETWLRIELLDIEFELTPNERKTRLALLSDKYTILMQLADDLRKKGRQLGDQVDRIKANLR